MKENERLIYIFNILKVKIWINLYVMGTQPKNRMDTIEKGNYINWENKLEQTVQRKNKL